MFDFGDELTVESYKIPWLIWVQMAVMFLLILLLYCFALISSDPTTNHLNLTSSSSSSSSSSRFVSIENPQKRSDPTNLSHNTQVGEIQSLKGCEIVAGTSRRVVIRRDDLAREEREDQVVSAGGPNVYLHPCFYFRLARTAFLKCLGLESPSESSMRKKKEE